MRGLRSFLVLLAVAAGFGAYLYFVEAKRDPADAGEKRDKVFSVESDSIEAITIKSEAGDRTTLKKNGEDWQLVEPAERAAVADAAEASGIATNLSTLEQQRVIDENPKDLAEYGLAQPRIEVTFTVGGKEQTLQLGAKTPTGNDIYAKVAGQPKVFLIAAYLESTFNRSTFELRDKTALKVDATKVDSVEVVSETGTKRFTKVDGAWQLASPAEPRSDSFAIDSAMSRVIGAQMKALAPDVDVKAAGLDKPAATVRIGTGSSQATLLIGKAADDGAVYAKDEARPEIFTIESGILDELKKPAVEFRQKDIFDARSFNTTRVEIARGGETWTFEKVKEKDKDGNDVEKWRQLSPAQKDADAEKLNSLLTTLTGARAESFVDKAPAAKPELTVALTFDDGKQERVSFAKSGADGFAMRGGSPGAAKVPGTLVDEIVKSAETLK